MRRIGLWLLIWLTTSLNGVLAQAVHELTETLIPLKAPLLKSESGAIQFIRESGPIQIPFNGVLLDGFAAQPTLTATIRFWENDQWSLPEPLLIWFPMNGNAFTMAYNGAKERQKTRFQVTIQATPGTFVFLRSAGVFLNEADEERLLAGTTQAAIVVPAGRFKAPRLIRRSEWNARAFACTNPDPQPYYTYLTLHHTAWPVAQSDAASYKNMKDIQDFHITGRGWCDIGYQFLMDQRGNLFQGRPFMNEQLTLKDAPQLVIGSHVGNGNTGNIGLSLMGCFHPPENTSSLSCLDKPGSALLDSVVTWFTFMADTYKVNPDNFRGHRDFNSTSCPGDNNYVLLNEIRTRVKANLAKPPAAVFAGVRAQLTENSRMEAQILWSVSSEQAGTTYRVLRKDSDGTTTQVGIVAANSAEAYQFKDDINSCSEAVTYSVVAAGIGTTDATGTTPSIPRPVIAEGEVSARVTPGGLVDVDWGFSKDTGLHEVEILRVVPGGESPITDPAFSATPIHRAASKPLDSFIDRTFAPIQGLRYRLDALDKNGCRQTLAEREATFEFADRPLLAPAYPNPFNPSTTFRFFIKDPADVTLSIFDLQGRKIATLISGSFPANSWNRAIWEAHSAAVGHYFAVLSVTTNGKTVRKTQKVTLIK
ncbi:MAG: N-acetylmuramoyl-L-alanine amidase [Bacteroidetes Order II. Incertae sedis bacterium]|nr:N-acetylmuramoyl-L-alanine amidase [Bacteroidetes Order II. bacterium]